MRTFVRQRGKGEGPHGIAKNHPFLDGNRRIALVAALAFLEMNGRALKVGFGWAEDEPLEGQSCFDDRAPPE